MTFKGIFFPMLLEYREELGRVAILLFVAFVGLKVGRMLNAVNKTQRMLAVMASVPQTPPPQGTIARVLNTLLGPVMPLYLGTPWEVMRKWVTENPPIIQFRILMRPCVVVGNGEGLKRIFQTKQRLYDKDLGFSYYPFLPILGSGLVTADGLLWQKQRVLIGPALRVDILDDVVGIATAAVERLSSKLRLAASSGGVVDMEEAFRLLTLQVIGEALLGLPHEQCDKVFPKLYLPVMEEANWRVLAPWRAWLPVPAFRFKRRVEQLNSFIIDILRSRWKAYQKNGGKTVQHTDVLSRILASVHEGGEVWNAALETQLCYEIKTFLLAGHETSAAMLTWTLYELTRSADALAHVRSEADVAFGKSGAVATREAVEAMDYTLAALKETLRKYSVVPVVTRLLSAPDQIEGHTLPAGTTVMCHLQAVHHSWKDPDNWRPQRFMPHGEYGSFPEDIRPYKFVPFIQGPRNCLGQLFALLEARVVLGLLTKRFEFHPTLGNCAETHPSVIPVGPRHGMPMSVQSRT